MSLRDMGNDTSTPWKSTTLEEQPLEQNLSAASTDPVIPAAEPCTAVTIEGSSPSSSLWRSSSSSSSSSLSTDSEQKSMSDTDKGDGVICLDSEEDGTPPKKKRTVKEKKLKDSESKPKPKQKTVDNKVGREIHSVTRRVASLQKWPDAPSNMCELMTGWPAYNARTLPLPSEDVLQMKLLVNEAYSGTGNGAVSLHQQWRSLTSEAHKRYGPGKQFLGNVITETACDVEPMCREVLQALPEDHGTTVLVGGCRVLLLLETWNLENEYCVPAESVEFTLNLFLCSFRLSGLRKNQSYYCDCSSLQVGEDCRPRCVHGDLMDRISVSARTGP